ncbi:MAG TPA: hypothetical protein VHD33_06365, partial [Legionellaceae bacterium]|nr:hypothetical protein [Legionellaceae bacterium]
SSLKDEAVQYIAFAQDFVIKSNPIFGGLSNNAARLGILRARRLSVFLEPVLNHATYTYVRESVDVYLRRALAYINWIYFLPRLSANISILYHHLCNVSELTDIEAAVPAWTRFRAHWTRCWWEICNDLYWLYNGVTLCFFLTGGAVSPAGIALSVTMQALDLFFAITRACVDLYRYYRMEYDLYHLNAEVTIKKDLTQRIKFEQIVFFYQIFHFSVLMINLCLTLPTMAAVSTLWPVIGGVSSVMMTLFTHYIGDYFNKTRSSIFEPRPTPPAGEIRRGNSQAVTAN